MLTKDMKDEEGAIKLYKQTIEVAEKEGDFTTAQLFRRSSRTRRSTTISSRAFSRG